MANCSTISVGRKRWRDTRGPLTYASERIPSVLTCAFITFHVADELAVNLPRHVQQLVEVAFNGEASLYSGGAAALDESRVRVYQRRDLVLHNAKFRIL